MAADHPLDNVIGSALSTVHAGLSRGGPLARRCQPEFARFAGLPAATPQAFAALADDLAKDEVVALSVSDDPGFRGHGWPADLMRLVSRPIVARGETPFLHVLAENAPAIALYEKLGLRERLLILRRV